MDTLERNLTFVDNSFTGKLQTEKRFDFDAFQELVLAVYHLALDYQNNVISASAYNKGRDAFFLIYKDAYTHLIRHFCPDNTYTIHNLPEEYEECYGILDNFFRSLVEKEDYKEMNSDIDVLKDLASNVENIKDKTAYDVLKLRGNVGLALREGSSDYWHKPFGEMLNLARKGDQHAKVILKFIKQTIKKKPKPEVWKQAI